MLRDVLLLGIAALTLAACGRSTDEATVRATAVSFYAAVGDHHGAAACARLTADTRQALEQQESAPCARAVEQLKLSGRRAGSVRLYEGEAAVELRGADTVYLEDTSSGWRVSAAGCRGEASDKPAQCELQA